MFRIGLIALTGFVLAGALGVAAEPKKTAATPAEALQTLPGFKVELIHTSDPKTEGSWINMAKDDKGRLIISGQHNQPILRVTLKDGQVEKIEKLNLPISEAMGLLYAFDSLYVDGAGPGGYGLYRCKDTKGTGQYDEVKLLKKFNSGGGDHSAHAVVLGPDKMLYVLLGNFCDVPEGMAPDSPHRNYAEDLLLPRQPDGNGFAASRFAPGGIVLRTDPDGKKWDLMLGGFRNAYDMAFNADGELFTFDADMEWDWGLPWYRPIRINHCTSAAEFGWRNGAGKWPEYYPDSLGAVVNVGVGSPTGVVFGAGAKFPAKYQKAFLMCDWSYGRLIAAHLTPKGSSYTAEFENFLAPKSLKSEGKTPLNLTDVVIGDDGALYFVTGGRNTQSGLYRVSYVGNEPTAPVDLHDAAGAKERELRHSLEAFHGKKDPKALDAAWPHLNSDDRYLRYAARIAVESQPVAEWKERALAEKQPEAALTALLALARCGPKEVQPDLLAALERIPLGGLTEDQQLEKLRVLQLTFIRQGPPTTDAAKKTTTELDAAFPNKSERVNHELAQLLIYLRAPHVAEKCLRLAAEAKTQEDELFYVYNLRHLAHRRLDAGAAQGVFRPFQEGPQAAAAFAGAGAVVRGRRPSLHRWFQLSQLREAHLRRGDREPVRRRAQGAGADAGGDRPGQRRQLRDEGAAAHQGVQDGGNPAHARQPRPRPQLRQGQAGLPRLPVHQVPPLRQRGRRRRPGPDGDLQPVRAEGHPRIDHRAVEGRVGAVPEHRRDDGERQDHRGPAVGGLAAPAGSAAQPAGAGARGRPENRRRYGAAVEGVADAGASGGRADRR